MAKSQRDRLTPQQLRAVELLAGAGMSAPKVAREIGVSPEAIRNWKKEDLFIEALDAAYKEMKDAVWAKMAAYADKAAQVLIDVAADAKEKGQTRVLAANSILDRLDFKGGNRGEEEEAAAPYETEEDAIAALRQLPPDLLRRALEVPGGSEE